MAAWAASYAAAGWRVFPAYGKVPAFKGWQQAATTDPTLLNRWWPRDDDSNVAAVTGESFDVFDIEVEHLPALLAHMRAGGRSLPSTPIANTGRGGLHIFTRPIGVDGTRRLFLDGTHIGELKSKGGLVLVCPSVTERQYTWRFAPAGMALAEAPDWLAALVDRTRTATRAPWRQASLAPRSDLAPLERTVRRAEMHNRNAALHWAACRAVEKGVPEALAQEVLFAASVAAEPTALRKRQARATIRSAYRRE